MIQKREDLLTYPGNLPRERVDKLVEEWANLQRHAYKTTNKKFQNFKAETPERKKARLSGRLVWRIKVFYELYIPACQCGLDHE